MAASVFAQMPPVPSMAPLPPQTNRYFITMFWTNVPLCGAFRQFTYGENLLAMTNEVLVPATNSNFSVNLSNLTYHQTYWFDFAEVPCVMSTQIWLFPSPQPPLTNTVTIGCTGPLQMKLLGLNSAWVDVTNKVFRLGQNQSYYWRSKARETVTIAMSNNQVNYGQFMHRQ